MMTDNFENYKIMIMRKDQNARKKCLFLFEFLTNSITIIMF